MTRFFSLAGVLLLAITLAACGPGRVGGDLGGTLEVTVSGVDSAEVTLSAAGVDIETRTVQAGETETFEDLTPGVYTVTGGAVEGFIAPAAESRTIGVGATEEVELEYLPATIANLAASDPELSTLVAALEAADLVDTLQGEGPYTVFAPTNAAFTALITDMGVTVDDLLALDNLADILLYHVAEGALSAPEILGLAPGLLETVEGSSVAFYLDNDTLVLNGNANVTTADLEATNGIIHVIDAVLMPLDAAAEVELTGEAEVQPEPVETDASGQAVVFLQQGDQLTVQGTYEGMTIGGPGVHIHGPAPAGENADILYPLEFNNETMRVTGTVTLTEEQLGWLTDGLLYINLHSELFPAGELRGQIIVDEMAAE